jgi:methyl-accepting chemotaxis protein
MALPSLTIRSRLFLGFGAVVALTVALAAFTGWQFLGVRGEIAAMATVSQQALAAREVAEQLQGLRRTNFKFIMEADQAAFKEAEEREAKTLEILKAAEATAASDERRAIYQGLQKSVEDLRANRQSLGELVARKVAGRDALFTGGDAFNAATQKLVQAAQDNGDPDLIQGAARLETDVFLTGIASWRFLATLDPNGALNFHVMAAKTARQIGSLKKPGLPPEILALIGDVSSSLKAYSAAFEQTSGNMIDANDLYAKKIRPLAIASSEIIDKLNLAYQLEFQAERARGEAAITATLGVQKLTTGLIVLLSAAVAFFVARGISVPLKLMNLAMQKLAAGDHNVAIPAQDKKDEIGEMAKSVLVFKDAAIENARLEAEAAAQRRRAESERYQSAEAQAEAIEQERKIVTQSIGAALAKLAAKDLTYRMPSDIPEAYRILQTDFNAAIGQLEAAMRGVTGSASAIQGGTKEISSASDDLSQRTEQQAASLEETAAALDEITATVKKSAENASHARQVVATADADAKQSASVVGQAVAAMEGIAKSAGQIGQIIGVMDEIAFQTNLLALNAGVEAARAGDAGRGFAVVASEVRALAQRSADAAKEIKALISASTSQVGNGVKLVAETGEALQRIMRQVAEINGIVSDIAAGAQEQATGLQQVNSALNQMDQVTQQNATMVEESTAASRTLSQEVTQLSNLVGEFRVAGASRDDSLRDQLKKAAPHAFRPPVKAPAARKAAPAVKAVAKGGADDWDEF